MHELTAIIPRGRGHRDENRDVWLNRHPRGRTCDNGTFKPSRRKSSPERSFVKQCIRKNRITYPRSSGVELQMSIRREGVILQDNLSGLVVDLAVTIGINDNIRRRPRAERICRRCPGCPCRALSQLRHRPPPPASHRMSHALQVPFPEVDVPSS